MSDIKTILESAKSQMEKTISHLESELSKIRAGKANPAMLDNVMVDYYGARTPLSNVASVNTQDSRTILVQPWEKSMLTPIEKAIQAANLGFNPQNDGVLIRIMVPALTEERRKQLSKTAKDIAKFNNSKDSIVFEVLKGKSIGLGYLSYIQKNPLLKSLRIGYLDSLGNRIPPQIVHQGFIIQKKYPFEIPIIAYLREKRQNLPWGFATFIEKDPNIQKVLLDCGLIPVFAKYNLIQED
jgi:ribosome recycling factor